MRMVENNITVDLFDVSYYQEKKPIAPNRRRSCSSLSFRLESDVSFVQRQKRFRAASGDVCFVPQNASYVKYGLNDRLIVFHFNAYGALTEDIRVYSPTDSARYRPLFEQALMIWNEKKTGYRFRAAAILYQILAMLQQDGADLFRKNDPTVALAMAELERNFRNANYKVAELSDCLYISETYLRRLFHLQLGMSPKRYLIKYRINQAQIMLKTTSASQTEIAQACGFSDVKYFRAAFKAESGLTVSQYRHRQNES